MKKIAQGAEAAIYKGKHILKDRFRKTYRLPVIDERLRKQRTRREAKILEKLAELGFPAPRLLSSDEKEKLEMGFIDGPRIRDILERSDYRKLCREMGKKIAVLHNNGIIHGDLTTSNMIRKDEIHFIDFGLSFFSEKVEDKAVDLHLLRQALESKHYTVWKACFEHALGAYREEAEDGKAVIDRLGKVEGRGRYKGKRKLQY